MATLKSHTVWIFAWTLTGHTLGLAVKTVLFLLEGHPIPFLKGQVCLMYKLSCR